MEGNFSQGLGPGGPSLHHQAQQSFLLHQHHLNTRQGSLVHPSIQDSFPLTMGTLQNCDRTISKVDYNKGERNKNLASDEDDQSFAEEGVDRHNDASKGKKGSMWQRVKWTDKMVKLLITSVSYIGEDTGSDCGGAGRRKFAVLQKKGKWKSISKVMAERAFHVSPQQCEDKFNDLNKRYKKLIELVGRGTSCQVVENPRLLDVLDYLTEKEKDDVRKILSSKHMFYQEMCSYHNGNRLHLPHDPALQQSLQLALRSKEDHDNDDIKRHPHDDFDDDDDDDDDQDVETDDGEDFEENHASRGDKRVTCGFLDGSAKRVRCSQVHEEAIFGSSLSPHDGNRGSCHLQASQVDTGQVFPESMKNSWSHKQWIESRSIQLEEQKLLIQTDMLELEKERFKWQRFSKKRDHELEKLRMENERMKLENDRMVLELKRKEMAGNLN